MEIIMTTYNPKQQYLISPETIFELNPALIAAFLQK